MVPLTYSDEEKTEYRMRAEYDFSKGRRGQYERRYAGGTNVVLLAPDVAKAFPTSKKSKRIPSETDSVRSIGMKQSGVGREGGNEALHFFTEPKDT